MTPERHAAEFAVVACLLAAGGGEVRLSAFSSEELAPLASTIVETSAMDLGFLAGRLRESGLWVDGMQELLWQLAEVGGRPGYRAEDLQQRARDLYAEALRDQQRAVISAAAAAVEKGERPVLEMPDEELLTVSRPTKDLVAGQLDLLASAAMGNKVPSPVIPMLSPFRGLNEMTGGGWRRRAINIVAARPGSGKSSFCEMEALGQAAAGLRVVFCPLEMGSQAHIERVMTRAAHAIGGEAGARDLWAPLTSSSAPRFHGDLVQRVEAMIEPAGQMLWCEPDSPSIDTLCGELYALHRKQPLDLILIDYFQMLADTSQKFGTKNYELASVAKKILRLAKRTGAAVVLVAQMNRGIENRDNKKPKLADLADCGEMDNFTHSAIFLSKEESPASKVCVTFTMAKARSGRPHSQLDLIFDGPGLTFTSTPENGF